MQNHVQVYKDDKGEWRWRFIAGNNKIMADSAEGYTERYDLFSALEEVFGSYKAAIPTAVPTDEGHDGGPVAFALISTGGAYLPVIVRD